MNDELYSYSRYKGFCLFVEYWEDDSGDRYEGVSQLNGTTVHSAEGITGDGVERKLMVLIDREGDDE